MALDLLADLTEERARSSRRRAEIVRTHATSLISPTVGQPSADRVATAALLGILREATDETESAARLGEDVFRRSRSGSLDRAKALLAATIPQLEEWADLGEAIRAALASPPTDDVRAAAEQYETAAQGLAVVLNRLKSLQEMYNRPRPPIDEERLRRGREEANAGKGMSAAEFLAELRARRG